MELYYHFALKVGSIYRYSDVHDGFISLT